jgi:hypothetical protein
LPSLSLNPSSSFVYPKSISLSPQMALEIFR